MLVLDSVITSDNHPNASTRKLVPSDVQLELKDNENGRHNLAWQHAEQTEQHLEQKLLCSTD